MSPDIYEVYAVKYATRDGTRSGNFIGGDPHDAPMPMDYFVWLIRNAERTFVVDTGFSEDMARQRKRTFLRTPSEGLALLGVEAATVQDVIITHMHYDHVGTFFDFPAARFHLQDAEMSFATGRYMRHGRFNHSFEVEDVVGMVRLVFEDRVRFHSGAAELAPGISVHHIGGHTAGLQCVRVATGARLGRAGLGRQPLLRAHGDRPGLPDRLPCRRDGRRLRQAARARRVAAAHHSRPRPAGHGALSRAVEGAGGHCRQARRAAGSVTASAQSKTRHFSGAPPAKDRLRP